MNNLDQPSEHADQAVAARREQLRARASMLTFLYSSLSTPHDIALELADTALEDPERIELRKIQHELANAISYLDTIRP